MTRARDVANIDGLLTTTGDTYYASAAGTPARLGIGSTDQVLKVSGGVPTWATPAAATSGLTLIKKASFSGAANTGTTFDNTLSATYNNYLLTYTFSAATTLDDWRMNFRYAGPTTESGNFYNSINSNQPYNASPTYGGTQNSAFILLGDQMASSTFPINGTMNILDVDGTRPNVTASWFNGEYNKGCTAFGICWNDRTYTGFIFSSSSSNIAGEVAVYGLAIA